ncbi:MAG: hypothetical protein JXA21_29805 [Anaerolineae bacterium]|nr:hypothetical protein [Anaerolineae bacterium]
MSTKVLIILEDYRNDQYMIRPLIQAMFEALGKSNARIEVCKNPMLTGVSQALDRERLAEVFDEHPMVDLFLLCVDRDCEERRRDALNMRETWARKDYNCALIAENAWQELEVWVLAGHNLPQEWAWEAIRAECNPKEAYFMPFAEGRQVSNTPGDGREILAKEAARRYDRIKRLCPEDIAALEDRLRQWLAEP